MWHQDEIRGLWMWWVGGHAVLAVLFAVLAVLFAPEMVFAFFLVIFYLLAFGALVGWIQKSAMVRSKLLFPAAMVERWHWRTVQAWIAALIVSQLVSLLLDWVADQLPGVVKGSVVVLVFGGVFGVMQWDLLKRYLSKSGWWIAATVSGWIVGPVFGGLVISLASGLFSGGVQSSGGFTGTVPVAFAASEASSIFAYGLITGSVLGWLVKVPANALELGESPAFDEYPDSIR